MKINIQQEDPAKVQADECADSSERQEYREQYVTTKEKMSPEAFHKNLRENGRKKLIDFSSDNQPDRRPPWLDEERFRLGRSIVQKYFLGIEFSSITGLFLILQCPDALEPLLSTGNSKDIPALFNRYINTILHVRNWYDYDIFNPETKGYKSIRLVRGMHKRLQQIMNDKFTVNDVNGKKTLWMTQYEVSVTQFSFIGMALVYPQKCGLIAATNEELESLNYYWRVLGYMMGVEDEFNCCYFDKIEDIRASMRLILEEELKPRLSNEPCPTGLKMCQGICIALADFISMITFNSLAHWWSDVLMFNGYELQPMTFKERCLTQISNVSFNKLFRYERFLAVSTKLHMMRFNRKLKTRDQIYQRLLKKYTNSDKYRFASDRVNYLTAKDNAINDDPVEVEKMINNQVGGVSECPFGFVTSKQVKQQDQQVELDKSIENVQSNMTQIAITA